ncbi:MAG: N-6 DNA methylase, partial [Alphaproteobacteria bacterium]|nr:N-6 DNA methylase [Alphaproteobacteria bacterium]
CRAGAPPALAAVQAEFRETLFAHAASGGYDTSDENALFANAFAQTLAFGLLLAREATAHEAARLQRPIRDLDRDAYRLLPDRAYPLLRATLRALTQDEILDLLAAGFDVLLDTVNAVDPAMLAPRAGSDPILYFYEDFLSVFDPEAKKRHGVFFTPVPVVRFMVAAADRALREHLAPQGLLDPKVLLLDPACGTGTFLIAALSAGAEMARAAYGEGAVAAEKAALAQRLHGFELLVGPYTVAHYRMQHELPPDDASGSRLPIYLADTLAPPAAAVGITSRLGFMAGPIVEERRAADALKRDTPIIAILGNPPYRRLDEGEEAGITSGWDNGFWEDLKQPVRNAGWGGELNTFPDLYVAFWRWSLWKLFECEGAPRRGVVSLITNRTFLAGHPYAGLRRMLRQRFDLIEIVDLRGDSRGARPAGIEADENVFAIQAGVCITTAVAKNGSRTPGTEAQVRYADVWRHDVFMDHDKRDLLNKAVADQSVLTFIEVNRSGLEDFLPGAFAGLDWPILPELFTFRSLGVQTKRDDLVYDLSAAGLEAKIRTFVSAGTNMTTSQHFHETRDRKTSSAAAVPYSRHHVTHTIYRVLDRRFLYNQREYGDFLRPELQRAWGTSNFCLYALPSGTGAGPAIWVHGLLPDYHSFRGSYGGYAFPLWDRRRGATAHNFNPSLLDGLSKTYGRPVSAQQAFDAIAALLSATGYTRRFAWDLEESFAHVPFPASADAFVDAARIGAEIRAIETFAREPGAAYRSARLAGTATELTLAVPKAEAFHSDGTGHGFVPLMADQSLRLGNVPERVWQFAVSGYRVLPRWLAARNGQALDAGMQRAILDVAWRIEELLHWFDAADEVLARAVAAPLTRLDLGMPEPGTAPLTHLEEGEDDATEQPA